MLRLRPYKSCDAEKISEWIKDEDVFVKWGGDHFGEFPITAGIIDDKYRQSNGDCKELDKREDQQRIQRWIWSRSFLVP